jgi:hypothetical protein
MEYKYVKKCTRSVSTPYFSVWNNTQVYLPRCASFPSISSLFNMPEEMDSRIPARIYGIVQLSTFYGLRISELLYATQRDVLPFDKLHIHGLKGSRDCQIFIPGICDLMQAARKAFACSCLWHLSYLSIWRSLRKAGFYLVVKNHQNLVVTHYGRYRMADDTNKNFGVSSTSDVLRHRSKSAVFYYISQGVN